MRSTLHWIGIASLVSGMVVLMLHVYRGRHEPAAAEAPTPAASEAMPKQAESAGGSRVAQPSGMGVEPEPDEQTSSEARYWMQLNGLREWLWSLGLYPGRSKTLHDYRLLGDRPVMRETDRKSDPRFRRTFPPEFRPIDAPPDRP
jgi:hypothetical protein